MVNNKLISLLGQVLTWVSTLLLNIAYGKFLGNVKFGELNHTEVVKYLSMVDVGLIPDPQNGLNEFSTMLKTMEYMAMGKLVIAFDLTETRYSAQDGLFMAFQIS